MMPLYMQLHIALFLSSICGAFSIQVPLEQLSPSTTLAHKRAITPELSSLVDSVIKQYNIPGVSIAVVHLQHGEVQEEYGVWGNKTEDGDSVTRHTLFSIASCSKAFTATAIGILMDDFTKGKNVTSLPLGVREFSWKTKIRDLFPEDSDWKLADQWASEKMSVADVLSHVSGLPGHGASYGLTESPKDIIQKFRYLKPGYELREQYSYNNQMYMFGAYIVARYSGKPFHEFVKERIFDPLDMASSTYLYKDALGSGNFSHMFDRGRRMPWWFGDSDVSEEILSGPGGVLTSSVDMNKWLVTLLNKGVSPYTNETVISQTVFNEVTSARVIVAGTATAPDRSILGYGMGWGRLSYKGHEVVTHNGGLPGFLTFVAFLPSDGLGIVAMVNERNGTSVLPSIGYHIMDQVLGLSDVSESVFNDVKSTPSMFFGNRDARQLIAIPDKTLHPLSACMNQTLPVPFEEYAGTYHDPGYGTLEICTIHTSPTQTSHCNSARQEFLSIYSPETLSHSLFGIWPKFMSRHILIEPACGYPGKFILKLFTIYPQGYGKDKTPFVSTNFEVREEARAEFVVRDGKVIGLAVPEGLEMIPMKVGEGPLEKTAHVYFTKVY